MKIISFNESLIDYTIKQDLLIPCYWYKIPVEINEGRFNFLEETVYKLKKIDDRLEIDEIAKMLGIGDKKDLVKAIFDKIENFKENNEKTTIYLNFFQEAISNQLLPIVLKEIKQFAIIKEDYFNKELNVRYIKFEKDNKEYKAYALTYNKNKNELKNEDFFKAILKNNKNKSNSNNLLKININKISNFKVIEPELVFLHTRFIIPQTFQDKFLISSGFDSGYFIELKEVIENNFDKLVTKLKRKIKIDSYITEEINLPFDLKDYPQIKRYFINIEKYLIDFDNKNEDEKQKAKEKIIVMLFDVIEKSFEILSSNIQVKTNKKMILEVLEKFEFEYKDDFNLFNKKNNSIQEYFAKTIISNKDEIKELEIYSKKSLVFIEKLLNLRNNLKHSKQVKLNNLDINKYKNISYSLVKILLRLKDKNEKEEIAYDEELYINTFDDIKKDFFDEYSLMDEFIKEKLYDIYFYINEIGYDKDKYNVVKEVVNNLYSIFEYLLKEKIKKENVNFSKQDVLDSFKDLPLSLTTVRNKMFENAKKGFRASLGAIYLIFLKLSNDRHKMTELIDKILTIRGHGNDVKIISKNELLNLKDDSFKLIKILIKD